MNLVPSKFEISSLSYKDFVYGNYTDENVLFKRNINQKPWHDLTKGKMLDYVASASPNIYGKHSSMLSSFSKNRITEYVDSEWIRWSLKTLNNWKCHAIENMEPGNTTPGIHFSEINMKFSHNLWVSSDNIYPECAPGVEFLINGDPIADDTGFIYCLQLKTTNEFEYVEPELLCPLINWCKRGANHSEASNEYGSSSLKGGPGIITYQSQLGSYSKSHETTDKAVHQILRLRGKDSKGCYMPDVDMVTHMSDAEFMIEVRYEREQSLFWGRDAGYNLIDPTTGYHRRTSPGMLEFYEDGNLLEYDETNFTVDFLREMFKNFFYGKVEPERANIKVKAGIELLTLVNKALTKEYAMQPVQKSAANYIKSGKSFPGSKQNGLHLSSPQFLGFDMFPYGTIEFEHMPILDDVEMNGGLVHPDTGRPLTSYWGFIDDIGIGGATHNLRHLILKGSEYLNHVCGAYSPAGAIDGTNNRGFVPAHSRRSYKTLYSVVESVMMMDTKRTLFLHPGVEGY